MRKNIQNLLLFFLPFLIVFQPFFLKEFQYILISIKLIIIPLWILFNIKSSSNFIWIFVLIAYLTSNLFFLTDINSGNKSVTVYLNVLSSLLYFIAGCFIVIKNKYYNLKYLNYGINLFNLSTIIIFILYVFDIYDLISFFKPQEDFISSGYENLSDRFSFANAIETPFLISSLLYIVLLSNPKKPLIFSTVINFSTAFISGSRLVLIFALVLLLLEIVRSGFKFKARQIFLTTPIFILVIYLIILSGYSDYILGRFYSADSSASAFERISFYTYFILLFPTFDSLQMLLGEGFGSSFSFVQSFFGKYRSIESSFLQFIYEIGILGSLIIFGKIISSFSFRIISLKSLSVIIILVQTLFFLPVYNYMPFVYLLLGFLSADSNKKLTSK